LRTKFNESAPSFNPTSAKACLDAIADAYRDAGRPFVSVTLPPQEVTSGVPDAGNWRLDVRVVGSY
jgi:hypothetical protein